MGVELGSRVRERREACGLSQTALAERAKLSRQSVGAIEAGRTTPAVDVALRIARALGCQVEELFGDSDDRIVVTEPSAPAIYGRVAMAQIAGRWVSYPLVGAGARISADGISADGIGADGIGANAIGADAIGADAIGADGTGAEGNRGKLEVESFRLSEARANVVVMGCAAGLGLLADRLNSQRGPGRFLWLPRSSTEALKALAKSQTHVAGVHLVDARTGEENVADVRQYLTDTSVVLVTLARWEAGLLTAPGNPKHLKRPADLARRGLRWVMRERGSGAQRLFDAQLREAGVSRPPPSACVQASGHLEVAHAISMGAGDVGVATRDAAIAFGLEFVPLSEERYDLVIPRPLLDDPRIVRLLEVMATGPVRRELSSLGYDVRSCGERVAELSAA